MRGNLVDKLRIKPIGYFCWNYFLSADQLYLGNDYCSTLHRITQWNVGSVWDDVSEIHTGNIGNQQISL